MSRVPRPGGPDQRRADVRPERADDPSRHGSGPAVDGGGHRRRCACSSAGIALVVRLAVLRRLQRFETTARADRRRRSRAARAGGRRRHHRVAGARVQHDGRLDDRACSTRCTASSGGSRPSSTASTTASSCSMRSAMCWRRTTRFCGAPDACASSVLGCSCRGVGTGSVPVRRLPGCRLSASRERQVRICERRTADGDVRWEEVHASPILTRAASVRRWSRSGATSPIAAPPKRGCPNRTGWRRSGCWRPGFSHELNTPLATVLMCVEGILREAQADGEAAPQWSQIGQRAAIAREQLLRCRGITQHFLRMSRGTGLGAGDRRGPATVTAVVRLIEPTRATHAVRVVLPPAFGGAARPRRRGRAAARADQPPAQCDPGEPAETRRSASEVAPGDPMRIRVADHGCGIAPEHQSRIFEPFFSLREGGTGLGLFLSWTSCAGGVATSR